MYDSGIYLRSDLVNLLFYLPDCCRSAQPFVGRQERRAFRGSFALEALRDSFLPRHTCLHYPRACHCLDETDEYNKQIKTLLNVCIRKYIEATIRCLDITVYYYILYIIMDIIHQLSVWLFCFRLFVLISPQLLTPKYVCRCITPPCHYS